MNRTLATMTDGERKALPVFDGALAYFPNALALISENSLAGQAQHEPDMPLMWHRHKSRDELGSLTRHLLDYAIAEKEGDYEGMLSATKAIAWRACAHAERFVATTEEDPERYQKVCAMRGESRCAIGDRANMTAKEVAERRKLARYGACKVGIAPRLEEVDTREIIDKLMRESAESE